MSVQVDSDTKQVLIGDDGRVLLCCGCPSSVHVEVCFDDYPFGFPPDVNCEVTVNEGIDIPLTLYECPIDFTTSGFKIQMYTGTLSSAVATGVDCGSFDPNPSSFSSVLDLYWDAVAMEWTIDSAIVFSGWPATFLYGPITVAVEDLIAASPITVVDDGCPGAEFGHNPATSIILTFS